MEEFLQAETLIIELLLIVSLVAIAVRRLRVPYTVALVVVGLLITFQSPLEINLTPQLILALFVPPLVFEAAFHINFTELRRNLPHIIVLPVPGAGCSQAPAGVGRKRKPAQRRNGDRSFQPGVDGGAHRPIRMGRRDG